MEISGAATEEKWKFTLSIFSMHVLTLKYSYWTLIPVKTDLSLMTNAGLFQ